MWLREIRINNLRNITEAKICPGNRLNILFGVNASGKSSILESIFMLGQGASFRTNNLSEAIGPETNGFSVSGVVNLDEDFCNRLDVRVKGKKKRIQINGSDARSRGQLLRYFPVQFVSPLSYQLIEGAPVIRRQYLDWGVFYGDPLFLEEWKSFKRSLVQRNAALRSGDRTQSKVWDSELIKYGTIVDDKRKLYLNALEPFVQTIVSKLLPTSKITLEYLPGWNTEYDLRGILNQGFEKDLKVGYTVNGPHRCDFNIRVNSRSCRSYVSRGQIKLIALSLKLAQINFLMEKNNGFGSFLIDDLCAELDRKNTHTLKGILSDLDMQCFITAMDRESLGPLCGISSTMFHVKHGRVKAI